MIGIFILIIIGLALFVIFVSEKIFERTNYFKKNYADADKRISDENVDFVNTGSTFAYYGIDYHAAGVKGLNLALCPQSLEDDFKMLKHFENRYNEGAVVFIVISDLAFAKKEYSQTWTRERYYRVLNADEIEGYNIFKAIRAKYFPVLYSWKNFLRFHWDIRPDRDYALVMNENDREAVEADAYQRCQSWMQEFDLNNLTDAEQCKKFQPIFEYTTGIVKEMVLWCQERGFRPILVNLPVSSEMKKSFSEEFLKAVYYHPMDQIGNVPFIDLQSDERLEDYLLYLDSCRLNAAGREIITRNLLKEAAGI